MSNDKQSNILPWVEASTLLGGALVAAIATSAISLYRIDSIEHKVDNIEDLIKTIPILQRDIKSLQTHDQQTQAIFEKFSDSVDKLTIAVARLEVKNGG